MVEIKGGKFLCKKNYFVVLIMEHERMESVKGGEEALNNN
jgi:hypothetical protein